MESDVRNCGRDVDLPINYSSQFNMNCTNFSLGEWKSLNLVRGIAALLGIVILLAILSFLIYYKAYKTLFQRLYLYLIIATILNELTGVINIEHQWHFEGQETLCEWLGLFLEWTYVLLFIFSYEIIFYLLYLVVSKVKGFTFPQCGKVMTRFCAIVVETVCILLPVLISTIFALPTYIDHGFGVAGPWCFVRSIDDNCDPIGKTAQISFYTMYFALGVVGISASILLSIYYCKLSKAYKETQQLLRQTLGVLIFQSWTIHIVLIVCSFSCRVYTLQTRCHKLYLLWLVHALAVPFGVLAFPIGYLLFFHPVRTIALRVYRKMTYMCCHKNPSASTDLEVKVIYARSVSRTIPKSERISQPSTTYFITPHPDSDASSGYYGSIN